MVTRSALKRTTSRDLKNSWWNGSNSDLHMYGTRLRLEHLCWNPGAILENDDGRAQKKKLVILTSKKGEVLQQLYDNTIKRHLGVKSILEKVQRCTRMVPKYVVSLFKRTAIDILSEWQYLLVAKDYSQIGRDIYSAKSRNRHCSRTSKIVYSTVESH